MSEKGKSIYRELNDSAWLNEKYWVEELSVAKIANIVECLPLTVWNALKRKNIKIRTLSEARKGKKNPNYGKHHSDKTRKKMCDAWGGVGLFQKKRKRT